MESGIPLWQRAALLAPLACALFGQSAEPTAFEVASIRPATPQAAGRVSTRKSIDGARVIFTNVTVADFIGAAYKVQQYQVAGPGPISSWRFDLAAKIPNGAPEQRVPQMFQALLNERFKLAFHRETRVLPVYALRVAKGGPKLQTAESASGIQSDTNSTGLHVDAKCSLLSFAEFLSLRLGRPVLDRTGLSGVFEIKAEWAPDPVARPAAPGKEAAPDSASGPSIFTALQEQLGLRLESARGPVDMLVVDHVEMPTEN
jgi:uncharacterized protein (TIGR03435 family)